MIRPYWIGLGLLVAGLVATSAALRHERAAAAAASVIAGPFRAQLEEQILAAPWPSDPREIAALGAALDQVSVAHGSWQLEQAYSEQQLHRLAQDSATPFATVRDALRGRDVRAPKRHASRDRLQPDLSWDRALSQALVIEPGAAEPTWPVWAPASIDGRQFRYDSAGAWVAVDGKGRFGMRPVLFPLRVTNRSAIELGEVDARVKFYYPEAERSEGKRPIGIGSCTVRIDSLLPSAATLVGCLYEFPTHVADSAQRELAVLAAIRSGRIQIYLEVDAAPDRPLWRLPTAAVPAMGTRLAQYRELQELDRSNAKHAADRAGTLYQARACLGAFAAGYLLLGALAGLGVWPGLGRTLLGVVAAYALTLVGAMLSGAEGYGPLVYAAIGFYLVSAAALGALLGRVLAAGSWRR